MAESSSSMTSGSTSQQADPLPQKRGEIGYNGQQQVLDDERASSSSPVNLPARHPADRDDHLDSPSNSNTPSSDNQSTEQHPANDVASTTTPSVRKKRFLKFFDSKKIPAYRGLRSTTLLACIVQILLIAGTITGWAVTAKLLSKNNGKDAQFMGGSSNIFVHVVFGIAVLGQMVFLERRLFMLRAQRWTFLHPGEILPSSRYATMTGTDPIVAWSPWNRPPLPTYAAALAQSGVGTGDVEDHLIAQNPPPAYGNTRGSTMVLQGFLRNSLRLQRPPSVHSQASRLSLNSAPGDRPLSYRSTDSGWDVIQDADRARRLEATLAALERPQRTASRTSHHSQV